MRLAGYLLSPSLRILLIRITTEGVFDSVKEAPTLAIQIVLTLVALHNWKVSAIILKR